MISKAISRIDLNRQLQATDELEVTLVDEPTMAELNQTWLGHRGATDVITFDYRGANAAPAALDTVAGEIYVCLDIAARAAQIHEKGFADEVVLYIVHGLLHLAGFDDRTASDRAVMKGAERRVMAGLRADFDLNEIFRPGAL